MKKPIIISIFSAVAVLGALIPVAEAQVYSYPTYTPASVYPGANVCVNLTAYQSLGTTDAMTGGQVTILQQFLNRTGYLSGVSGTYDAGTYGAVINFQNAHGILGTGTVGPETRAAISAQSCGNTIGNVPAPVSGNNCYWSGNTYTCGYSNYSIGGNTYYPSTPNYCGYGYNSTFGNCGYFNYIHINSLSNSYGYNGTTITVTGTGFSPTGNTVHFGSYTLTNIASYNAGTTLTFTVPTNCVAGTYSVTITNAAGMTSNSLSFQAYGFNNYNSSYPYNNCYNGTFGNCNYPYNGYSAVTLSNISGPSNVQVGTTNTWSITATNPYSYYNGQSTVSVNWGDNYGSNNNDIRTFYTNGSQSFSFTHTYMYPGTYTIRMTASNGAGATSYQTYTVYVSNYGTYYYSY